MRFDELPPDINDLPLDDPDYASGVIDLCLDSLDRVADSLLVLPCDERGLSLQTPIIIEGAPWDEEAVGRRRAMRFLAEIPVPGFVIALSSFDRLPDPTVARWLRTVQRQLDSSGQTLFAFGVADVDDVVIVGGDAASAAA